MDEFKAIALFLLEEMGGKTPEEQLELLTWAFATERWRTINEVQMSLGNTRENLERLVPKDFYENRELRLVMKLVNTANLARLKNAGTQVHPERENHPNRAGECQAPAGD